MKPKVLVIQFRINEISLEQEKKCLKREVSDLVELDYLSALDKNIDWNYPEVILAGYSGIILGGSGDLDFDGERPVDDEVRKISLELVEQLRSVFQYLFDYDFPTLGICYGHQMIGAFAGAEVCCDQTQKKTKSHELKLLVDKKDHFLFNGLPDSFTAFYGHKDVLDRVPDGAVLLCDGGEMCKVPALRYKTNIYTVQFHPELNYLDMIDRIKRVGGYVPAGVAVEEIFKDDPHSNIILRNFAKIVTR